MYRKISSIAVVLAFLACSPDQKNINIDKVNWVYANSPLDFTASTSKKPYTMSLDFTLKYSGDNLILSDINYVKIYSNGFNWNITLTPTNFNDSAKSIGYGTQYLYSTDFTSNGSVLPIGDFNFEVILSDGNSATKQVSFPAPGKLTANGYNYIYTEDYTGEVLPTYTKMITRPKVSSVVKTNDSLKINFTINDTLAYSGWIWFFGIDKLFIGKSVFFRDFKTKSFTRFFNDGAGIYTNGNTNSVVMAQGDYTMNSSMIFSDIAYIRVVCSDGKQYNIQPDMKYDCISISELTACKTK